MTDRDPYRDPEFRPMPASDPTMRASSRRALWSWVAGLAIVFILFVAFYGVSQRENRTLTSSAPSTATAPSTTGQGGSNGTAGPAGTAQGRSSSSGSADR